uniref:Serpin B6 n=1 Tax=Sinocyclocheilus anshuiensis TaxID=1608454 RepID=A0A671K6U3_9TELE
MERLSAANTRFSLNLFKKISEGNASKNVFYSPISISSALAMVSLGAKENTAEQMFQVLSFTNPPTHCGTPVPNVSMDQIHSSFNKLMSELNKPGAPYVLSLANRLYGEQSYQFTQTKPVKMMQQKSKFPLAFIPEMNSQVLELPYVGKNLSMLIILPNEIQGETTGLQKLEKALTFEKLMEWTKPSKMLQEEVQVSLPKFKMAETYGMVQFLRSMGMEDVFDPQKVNLSGMSSNNNLVVSKVIHKAFVEVNEEGTEAAAATGITITTMSMPLPRKTFIADHPFLFFVRHNPSNSILFYGRFCSP